ncbi:hypothetical protein NVV78_07320 [Pediococcus ethanolidurans]|uniref:hypothetical protein n=1 Tax=Lactobacillaceae TaxID=33958 RepID=UPI00209D9280|nr:hypothetical protein [Lactiplantibacillus plantarum]MCV3315749.1 hypothetical protein [Pediococcus ethanolidurans]USZ62455.1 hypothetical protein NHN12_16115 [Lactiplantibacillus plantarum]
MISITSDENSHLAALSDLTIQVKNSKFVNNSRFVNSQGSIIFGTDRNFSILVPIFVLRYKKR